MKVLIFTDVHWSSYSSIVRKRTDKFSVRLNHLIDSMNWVEKLGKDLNCDLEICCGDFMDSAELNAEEITALSEIKWNNIDKRFIVGNHDSNVQSLKFNTVEALHRSNIKILSEVYNEHLDNVDFMYLPYNLDYDYLDNKIKEFSEVIGDKFIFAHADIKGLSYGRFQSTNGIDVNVVKDSCNMLFNGHLHEGGMVADNIINVGSLSAHNFNNNSANHDYGVYVLDTTARSIEFIVNPYAFNFYKLFINKLEDIDNLKKLKNNSVLSVTCRNELLYEVDTTLKSLPNVVDYKIIVSYATTFEDDTTVDFNVDDHLKQFIDYVQTKIEPSPVLSEELTLLGSN